MPASSVRKRDQFCRATRRSLVQTDACDPPSPQADRGDRFNPTSASPNPRQNPHSARGSAPAYVPRFRALALFGRRPPQRVEGFVMPASKNLHNNGLGTAANSNNYSTTLEANPRWCVEQPYASMSTPGLSMPCGSSSL